MIFGEQFYELSPDERIHFAAEDCEDGWDQETGKPGVGLFGNAVQVWSITQNHTPVTVAEAAAAFNVAPSMIVAAVKAHPWMFLEGQEGDFSKMTIEHEGE